MQHFSHWVHLVQVVNIYTLHQVDREGGSRHLLNQVPASGLHATLQSLGTSSTGCEHAHSTSQRWIERVEADTY